MRFARWTFGLAALYGLLATVPGYVANLSGGAEAVWPAAFFGAAAATQLLYVVIARDPRRHRGLIPVGIVSKLSFAAAVAAHRPPGTGLAWAAAIDLMLAVLFALHWWRLRPD